MKGLKSSSLVRRHRLAAYPALLLLVWLPGLSVAAQAEFFFARATAVPDGDTLWVQPEAGGAARKLRLQGIDAPEICQAGGVAARDSLRLLVLEQRLQIQANAQDDYGRTLVRIQINGQDLGETLVRRGQAWSYRWRRSLGPYAQQETLARLARKGLFASPDAELPRDFRRRHGSCYESDDAAGLRLR